MARTSKSPAESPADDWLGYDPLVERDRYVLRRLGELGVLRETWNALPEETRRVVDRGLDHIYGVEWRLRCLLGTDGTLRDDPAIAARGVEELKDLLKYEESRRGPRSFDALTTAGIRRPFARHAIAALSQLLREATASTPHGKSAHLQDDTWLDRLAERAEKVLKAQAVFPRTSVERSDLERLSSGERPEAVARRIVTRACELSPDDLRRSRPRRRGGRKA